MILPLTLWVIAQPLDLNQVADLARGRNEQGMARFASPELAASRPFRFLSVNGAYGGGSHGWVVKELSQPNGPRKWLVFSTALDCEDVGEQVFEVSNGKMIRKVNELETFGVEPRSMNMLVQFDPPSNRGFFDASIQMDQSADSPTAYFHVRLAPHLTVRKVEKDGRPLQFTQALGTLCLPLTPNSTIRSTYRFVYDGVFNDPPERGSINEDEAMLTGSVWWPQIARGPMSVATTIESPQEWLAVTHGNKISEEVQGEKRITKFDCRVPISVFSLSAGKYKRVSEKIDGREYWTMSRFMDEASMKLQNRANAEVFKFYDTLIKLPFDNYGSLVSNRFGSGALEAYSYATYQGGWLPAVEPHETAHALFGGVIPNTYLRSLWNESFATFAEEWYRREGVEGNREDLRLAFRSTGDADDSARAWPAISASAEVGPFSSSIGYGRGGKILGMLEREMGEGPFRKAVSRWLKEHPRGEPGEWEGFESTIAKSGKSFKWFFDQWLRRAGFAEFDLRNVRYEPGFVRADLVFVGSPYRMNLEMLTIDADGTSQLHLVEVEGKSAEEIAIPVTKAPAKLSVDPYLRIHRRIAADERAYRLSKIPRGRPLVQTGKEDWLEALRGSRRLGDFVDRVPENPSGKLIIGDPRSMPGLSELLKRLPEAPVIEGDLIKWRGQSVPLGKGGFAAVIPLEAGESCTVMFGNTLLQPSFGEASAVLFNDLGVALAATAEPKKSGRLVYEVR